MISLARNCPHCQTEKAGFTLVGEGPAPNGRWHALFRCNVCFGPLAAEMLINARGLALKDVHGELQHHANIGQIRFFPKAAPSSTPAHTPESVQRAFIQAEDAIRRQHWEAAAAMDRRALEIATKELSLEHASQTLYKRIELLADAGKLTPSLKEWAHDLRIVGNGALHEISGLDETEATQAHELTRFILTYLYTLPAQVEQARAHRENGK